MQASADVSVWVSASLGMASLVVCMFQSDDSMTSLVLHVPQQFDRISGVLMVWPQCQGSQP